MSCIDEIELSQIERANALISKMNESEGNKRYLARMSLASLQCTVNAIKILKMLEEGKEIKVKFEGTGLNENK